jgi:putative isomerase
LINSGELHEYYDPEKGTPIINPGFQNWNLLSLNMLAWLKGENVVEEF